MIFDFTFAYKFKTPPLYELVKLCDNWAEIMLCVF